MQISTTFHGTANQQKYKNNIYFHKFKYNLNIKKLLNFYFIN